MGASLGALSFFSFFLGDREPPTVGNLGTILLEGFLDDFLEDFLDDFFEDFSFFIALTSRVSGATSTFAWKSQNIVGSGATESRAMDSSFAFFFFLLLFGFFVIFSALSVGGNCVVFFAIIRYAKRKEGRRKE